MHSEKTILTKNARESDIRRKDLSNIKYSREKCKINEVTYCTSICSCWQTVIFSNCRINIYKHCDMSSNIKKSSINNKLFY